MLKVVLSNSLQHGFAAVRAETPAFLAKGNTSIPMFNGL